MTVEERKEAVQKAFTHTLARLFIEKLHPGTLYRGVPSQAPSEAPSALSGVLSEQPVIK